MNAIGLGERHGVPLENYNSGRGVWQGGRSPIRKAQNELSDYCWGLRRPQGAGHYNALGIATIIVQQSISKVSVIRSTKRWNRGHLNLVLGIERVDRLS